MNTHTYTHTHTHEHTHVCIAVFIPVTFPDERDLCVLICSGDIKWYNECVSCYLYLAPVSLYTILHDGKYFITDFCTDWNIITVMWINTMWFIHFIFRVCFNELYKWHIFSATGNKVSKDPDSTEMCLLYLFCSRLESKLSAVSSNMSLSGTYFFADNFFVIILCLHRALNKVTQSANQHMHTFNFFIY